MPSAINSAPPVCGQPLTDYLLQAEEFHGHVSPGLVLGGYLVDAAWSRLGQTNSLNAVVETVVCLPDAVQILTPCTMGNNFMQVLDWGKFALTLYDRQRLLGFRAWADRRAIAQHPEVAGWFLRGAGGLALPKEQVVEHLARLGPGLVGVAAVRLPRSLKSQDKVPTGPCPRCGESYPLRLGDSCPACQGRAYYQAL